MQLIEKIKNYRATRKKLARMKEFSSTFNTIATLFEKKLLVFDAKKRRLFIHNTLADVMLAKGVEGWTAFLNNVFMAVAFQQMSGNWESYFKKMEDEAVAKAWKEHGELSTADVQRIKRVVRDNIRYNDKGMTMPMEFEFFIIYDRGDTADTVAVGHYDAEKEVLEMETWDVVMKFVRQMNEKPTYGKRIRTK